MIIGGNVNPPGKITVEGEQFIVGLPMLRALNPYIDYVQGLQMIGGSVFVEHRVKLLGSSSLVWGTTDCAAQVQNDLFIADLKYGMGVPVDPGTAQLKIYGLAAWDSLWPVKRFDFVHLTVIQPRLNPVPQTVSMEAKELVEWRLEELEPAIARIVRGDETEKVGPYCRWCVRKPECDAFKHYKSSLASDIFDDGVDTLNT